MTEQAKSKEGGKKSPINEITSYGQFYIDTPPYHKIKYDPNVQSDLFRVKNILECTGPLDCYCIYCKNRSIFNCRVPTKELSMWGISNSKLLLGKEFNCSRNVEHAINFSVTLEDFHLVKYGQFPSMADLALPELKRYRKVLSEEGYADFARGVGLAAHGVGIGSFVYLRRILEDFIEEAYQLANAKKEVDEELYKIARAKEKIQMLAAHLPDFLVQRADFYSILSEGIHSLTEDECISAFPIMKLGIEAVLDEKLHAKIKADKQKEADQALQKFKSDRGQQKKT